MRQVSGVVRVLVVLVALVLLGVGGPAIVAPTSALVPAHTYDESPTVQPVTSATAERGAPKALVVADQLRAGVAITAELQRSAGATTGYDGISVLSQLTVGERGTADTIGRRRLATRSADRAGVAAKAGASGADDVLNGVRLRAQLTGQEISGGHAFGKPVVQGGEFPGITTRSQFAQHIEDVVSNGIMRPLERGRTAYWQNGTVVIRNPDAVDGGTAFRPKNGYDYFLGLD